MGGFWLDLGTDRRVKVKF